MQRCNKTWNRDLFQTRNFSEPDSCLCTTSFCNAALVSTKFLFPFVIEFSLVASCLLIVTWGNIGKQPPPCECIVKPSYKFYKAYTGIVHDTFLQHLHYSVCWKIALIYVCSSPNAKPISLPIQYIKKLFFYKTEEHTLSFTLFGTVTFAEAWSLAGSDILFYILLLQN